MQRQRTEVSALHTHGTGDAFLLFPTAFPKDESTHNVLNVPREAQLQPSIFRYIALEDGIPASHPRGRHKSYRTSRRSPSLVIWVTYFRPPSRRILSLDRGGR